MSNLSYCYPGKFIMTRALKEAYSRLLEVAFQATMYNGTSSSTNLDIHSVNTQKGFQESNPTEEAYAAYIEVGLRMRCATKPSLSQL
jgi:hypothetical protein